MKKTLLLTTGLLLCIFLFSQDYSFRYLTEHEQTKEVVFSIVGVRDSEHAIQIISTFESYEQVISCKIFYNRRCKMTVSKEMDSESAEKCRAILQTLGVDFDPDYLLFEQKEPYLEMSQLKKQHPYDFVSNPKPSDEWVYPESFPKFSDTGNPGMDNTDYARAKQAWIEEHPEEYRQMTGIEYLDYSIYNH